MWRNTNKKWGWTAKILHWGMGIIIIGMLGVGLFMVTLPPSPEKWTLYALHKSFGLTIFALAFFRLWWRLKNPIPVDLAGISEWENKAAKMNIVLLYFLMFAFPLSGFIMSSFGGHPISYFDLFTIPHFTHGATELSRFARKMHTWFAYSLLFFGGPHILAALYHHFILKNRILQRMLP